MLIGLNAAASSMADPFGNDDTDFDTKTICDNAYRNAFAYLKAKYPEHPLEPEDTPLELRKLPLDMN